MYFQQKTNWNSRTFEFYCWKLLFTPLHSLRYLWLCVFSAKLDIVWKSITPEHSRFRWYSQYGRQPWLCGISSTHRYEFFLRSRLWEYSHCANFRGASVEVRFIYFVWVHLVHTNQNTKKKKISTLAFVCFLNKSKLQATFSSVRYSNYICHWICCHFYKIIFWYRTLVDTARCHFILWNDHFDGVFAQFALFFVRFRYI